MVTSTREATERVATAVRVRSDLTELDQAMADGDLGITAGKMAAALMEYAANAQERDLGKYLVAAGMAVNQAASSSLGTLFAAARMRAGKEVAGKAEADEQDLASMLNAADLGIQELGKAKPGDKTVIDGVHPAAEAFSRAVSGGANVQEAGTRLIEAAKQGREPLIPRRSKIGRASWVGERTEGKLDPGCAAGVISLKVPAGRG